MAYATLRDVEALNPQRGPYGDTTVPTAAAVEGFIADIAAEIDAVLGSQNIVAPVTEPSTFLAVLRRLNALGAAGQAEMAAFPNQPGGGDVGGSASGPRYWRMYQDGLTRLVNGEGIPSVALMSKARIRPRAATYAEDAPAPVFSMSQLF